MRVGYARVSTSGQNPEPQLDELRRAGCERVFPEKASGARDDRPELARTLLASSRDKFEAMFADHRQSTSTGPTPTTEEEPDAPPLAVGEELTVVASPNSAFRWRRTAEDVLSMTYLHRASGRGCLWNARTMTTALSSWLGRIRCSGPSPSTASRPPRRRLTGRRANRMRIASIITASGS